MLRRGTHGFAFVTRAVSGERRDVSPVRGYGRNDGRMDLRMEQGSLTLG